MSAIIAALASYLTTDLLMALLLRTGLFGGRTRAAARVARRLAPLTGRIVRRLQERRHALPEDSEERRELDEEIAALSTGEAAVEGRR